MFDVIRSFRPRFLIGGAVAVAMMIPWLGCGPSDPVEEAASLIEQGRARAAIELLEPVVREDRDNFDAQFHYGQALTMIGEGGLAEWALRRAMQDPERRRQAGMMIVNNALQGGNPQEAVKVLTELLEETPDDIPLLLARAEAYGKTRIDVEKVLEDVDRIRDIEPDNLEAHRAEILGYLLAAMTDEAAEALEILGERIEEHPNAEAIGAWYCTTMALFAKESLDKDLAEERFDACVEEYPAEASVVEAATGFFQEEGRVDRAIEIYEGAMALRKGKGPSPFSLPLAELYFTRGRFDDAEALLLAGSQSENLQVSVGYKFQLADLYDKWGRLDDALAKFEEAAAILEDLDALTETIRLTHADLAIRAGDTDRALEIAALLEQPPFRLMVQARAAQEKGDHAAAIQLYDEAARLWPDNEFARYHAARSAEQLGDFDRAIELYRHTTRISGDATNAMSRIGALYHASGRSIDALEVLRLQEMRAPLDPMGELLKVELVVLIGYAQNLSAYLASLPRNDAIGFAPRLARVFRALALRGEASKALEVAGRLDPRVFGAPGGARALEELTRAFPSGSDDLDRVEALLDKVVETSSPTAGLASVRGLIAEKRGANPDDVARLYASAVELDPDEPMALLGRARGLMTADPAAAVALGERALASESVLPERVTELALLLMDRGAAAQGLELCEAVLRHTPFDGRAAEALASAAFRDADYSDRTLNLARRAARFARTERSMILLRDTYAARGEASLADEITERIERQRESAKDSAASRPSANAPAG